MILKDDAAKKWLAANSPHFSYDELKCKCGCGSVTIDTEFITKLNQLRIKLETSLCITSGYRCPAHNRSVGGAAVSYHTRGMAIDIAAFDPKFRAKLAETAEPHFGGIRIYNKQCFVHLDNRPMEIKHRWAERL